MPNSPDKFPKNSFSLPHQEYSLPVSKRKVIKNLKDNVRNAEVMSNRLKVLTSQEEYNRIRAKIENIKL
jgi:chaperonin cofactor prefoldin